MDLSGYIRKSGLKKSYLASVLGCSRARLYMIMKDPSTARCSEVKILVNELSITKADRDSIFFA